MAGSPGVDWWTTRDDAQLAADARSLFAGHFDSRCEGVWAAPGRVNLIGEHVDYAGGVSLPFALPQNTAAAVGRRSDGLLKLVSVEPGSAGSDPETFAIALDDIGPGNPATWAGYAAGAVWAGLQDGVVPHCGGLDIALVSDVPVGAGLSSSAALECSVALAAYELAVGHPPEAGATERLIAACMRAENEVVGASTGGLDQCSSFHGRPGQVLAVDFLRDTVDMVPCDLAGAGLSLLIINTNAKHRLVDGQYASRRGVVDAVAGYLGVPTVGAALESDPSSNLDATAADWSRTPEAHRLLGGGPLSQEDMSVTAVHRITHVVEEIRRTREQAVPLLRETGASLRRDAGELGALMNASHDGLRDLFEVTVPELDTAQEAALASGALGARMTGGGFGGSVIALVAKDGVDPVAAAVAAAAADRGFPSPTFFTAEPSAGARRLG